MNGTLFGEFTEQFLLIQTVCGQHLAELPLPATGHRLVELGLIKHAITWSNTVDVRWRSSLDTVYVEFPEHRLETI